MKRRRDAREFRRLNPLYYGDYLQLGKILDAQVA
jgi:hypothetical protein